MSAIANSYIQLGVAGATLFLLLIFITGQTKSNDKREIMQFSKIDKLCDRIDAMVTSQAASNENLNKVLLSNDKDQKETIKLLNTILTLVIDIQKKMVRVDDRTYNCIGVTQQEERSLPS